MAGGGLYRTEHVKLAMARESVDGTAPGTVATNFGLIKGGVMLPDFEHSWDYFWGVGRDGRFRRDAHEGNQTLRGGIPQCYVLYEGSRDILEICLGALTQAPALVDAFTATTATTGTDSGAPFSSYKDGTFAIFSGVTVGYISTTAGAGNTEVTVYPTPARTGTAGWNGPQPGSTDAYEVRKSESVGVAAGNKTIVQLTKLNTMTWAARFRGSLGQANMTVNYLGGKVNRWTLSARQGEKLTLALDEVIFRDLRHDVALPTSGVQKYTAAPTAPTATHPTEEPMVFSQGTVSLFSIANTYAKINSIAISGDNQLTEQRYISKVVTNGQTITSQVPYEITEGPAVITATIEAVMESRDYWAAMQQQGQNSALTAKTGFDILLKFEDRTGRFFYLQAPGQSAPVMTNAMDGTNGQASSANVGCVLEISKHPIPTETESLVIVQMRATLPNVVLIYDD